jgi:hypothetical protein
MDWSFPPELQKRYEEILARTRSLQKEFGIESRTIEQRYQDYLKRQEEENRRQEELSKLIHSTGNRRPPPKWTKNI